MQIFLLWSRQNFTCLRDLLPIRRIVRLLMKILILIVIFAFKIGWFCIILPLLICQTLQKNNRFVIWKPIWASVDSCNFIKSFNSLFLSSDDHEPLRRLWNDNHAQNETESAGSGHCKVKGKPISTDSYKIDTRDCHGQHIKTIQYRNCSCLVFALINFEQHCKTNVVFQLKSTKRYEAGESHPVVGT